MRLHIPLLSLALCACGPKADSPPTTAPGDDDASEFADDDSDADDETAEEAPAVVEATLHNLCDKPQQWVIIEGDVTPDPSAGQELAPGATTPIELGPDHYVARKDDDGQWSSRARAKVSGGHVWLSSSCQGVGSSDDPDADPAAADAQMLETMRAASGG